MNKYEYDLMQRANGTERVSHPQRPDYRMSARNAARILDLAGTKRHAALEARPAVKKRCRRCALPPHYKMFKSEPQVAVK